MKLNDFTFADFSDNQLFGASVYTVEKHENGDLYISTAEIIGFVGGYDYFRHNNDEKYKDVIILMLDNTDEWSFDSLYEATNDGDYEIFFAMDEAIKYITDELNLINEKRGIE